MANAKPPKGRRKAKSADGGNLFSETSVGKVGDVRRSWIFKYELDDSRREMGLGSLGTVSSLKRVKRPVTSGSN